MIPLPERTTTGIDSLTPREIVAELDKYVVGQSKAKRAVAIALRNRLRRQKLPADLAEDVAPEEHPDDRPDRRRQDRDRAAAGEAGAFAVHQGRSLEVHRSRLCRPRRRVHGPRSRRARGQHGARRAHRRSARQGGAQYRGAAARSAAAAAAGRARRRSGPGARRDERHPPADARAAARRQARRSHGGSRRAGEIVSRRSSWSPDRRWRKSASTSAT